MQSRNRKTRNPWPIPREFPDLCKKNYSLFMMDLIGVYGVCQSVANDYFHCSQSAVPTPNARRGLFFLWQGLGRTNWHHLAFWFLLFWILLLQFSRWKCPKGHNDAGMNIAMRMKNHADVDFFISLSLILMKFWTAIFISEW